MAYFTIIIDKKANNKQINKVSKAASNEKKSKCLSKKIVVKIIIEIPAVSKFTKMSAIIFL